MKALVATVNCLLLVDLQTKFVKIIESNRPEYYGISWWGNTDSLVLSHSGLANDSLVDMETYICSEKGYLSFGKPTTQPFLSQPHQILCAPNHWVITTNTGRNCVTLYDPSNGFYKDIRVNDVNWDRLDRDNTCGEHFNSIYLKNNRLYVLAHRFKKVSEVLEFSYPDCVLIEKYITKQRSGLHNIWVDDAGNMLACNSNSGELIELKTNETLWTPAISYYSRGLAATTDIIVVGDSQNTARANRSTSPSELWIIDRKTFMTLDHISLGPFGSVHEVRLVDVPDEAHHNTIFAGLDNLEKNIEARQCPGNNKLKQSQTCQANRHLLQNFDYVANSWIMNEEEWLAPKDEGFTLALAKETFSDNYTASLDYFFPESATLSSQNISLVVGYRGSDDTNMIAILILHAKGDENACVALWINTSGIWEPQCILIPEVPKQGKLSVSRQGNKLVITCNDFSPVTKKLDSKTLDGAVGVRCLGSQFKNFAVVKNPEKIKSGWFKRSLPA